MATATMTSKGQLTIPLQIRRELGLKPGVRIDFYKADDGEYVFRPRAGSIMDLRGCLAYDGPPLSIEEMDRAIADHVAALDTATMSGASDGNAKGEAA